jgi:hypothetical protein
MQNCHLTPRTLKLFRPIKMNVNEIYSEVRAAKLFVTIAS